MMREKKIKMVEELMFRSILVSKLQVETHLEKL